MARLRRPPSVDTAILELGDARLPQPQRLAVSNKGMIATQHYLATDAGNEILKNGGNAIDAAVAAAFALGICEPAASGLGGQTMMLIHLANPKRTFALDGSSRAPNRATPNLLKKPDARRGYRATTVPSTPAVLSWALEHYGTKPLAETIAPAIRLAEGGYRVSALQYSLARRELKHLRNNSAAPFFLRDSTKLVRVGSTFHQPVLAKTLKRIADHGIEDFYLGKIASLIHADMQKNEGLLHLDDLAQIPWPVERRPVTHRYNGKRLFTFSTPGAGRTLIEMLGFWEQLPQKYKNTESNVGLIAMAEVIRRALLDRRDRPFDPNYYAQVLGEGDFREEYAKLVAKKTVKRIRSTGETTHLSVMDNQGNVVALTQSIERVFGSCVATPELGFLYNNYMSAFEYNDMAHPYYLRPNASPWASVAPTIIFKGRNPWLAIGSPGSERIVSSIFQVLLRLESMPPLAAVEAPRLHCSLGNRVSLEASRFRDDLIDAMQRFGFTIDVRDPYSFYLGCVQLVLRDADTFFGVADPRRDGAAGGP